MRQMLIVDDEAFARQAVADSIDWEDYDIQVFQASSGEEAVEFLEGHPVDLLMTDIRMSGISGLELIEKVFEKGWNPAIIVLSSYNEFDLVRSAMKLGANDYLFKPTMMPGDIVESVLQVLKKRKESEPVEEKTEAGRKEYLQKLLLGERGTSFDFSTEEREVWECRNVLVIVVKIYHYRECLSRLFEEDLNLFQFSMGNILGEILGKQREYEVFRMNYREYAVIAWKSEKETVQKAETEIYQNLQSGFTFLKLYYEMDAVAGVSEFEQGMGKLSDQYTQAAELCGQANPKLQKILFAGGSAGQGSLKKEMQQALRFIEENLGNPELSLGMVADKIGVSKNYFSRIFKETMNEKFVSYVTRLRMEQARNLYLNSDLKIYEISEMVGYSDWHYLYNLYKKTYGHSLSKEKESE